MAIDIYTDFYDLWFYWWGDMGHLLVALDDNFRELESYINDNIGGLISGVYTALSVMDNRIDAIVAGIDTSLSARVGKLESDYTALWQDMIRVKGQVLGHAITGPPTLKDRVGNIEKDILNNIKPQLAALSIPYDTLYNDLYIALSEDIDNAYNALSGDIDDIYTYIEDTIAIEITALSEALLNTEESLTAEIIAQVADVRAYAQGISLTLSNSIASVYNELTENMNNINVKLDDKIMSISNALDSALNDVIYPLRTQVNTIEDNITKTINPTLTALSNEIDTINNTIGGILSDVTNIVDTKLAETEQDISALEAELTEVIDLPIALLVAILNDKQGIYTKYRRYWQLFTHKLLQA